MTGGRMDGAAYLSDARAAAVRLRSLDKAISGLESEPVGKYPRQDPSAPQVRTSGLSDPTYTGALSARAHQRRLEWLRSERDGCLARVGECSDALLGMAAALGPETAETCRLYYLDPGATWDSVAEATGVTVRTALRRRSVAVDWLSDVGLAHAVAGHLTRGRSS